MTAACPRHRRSPLRRPRSGSTRRRSRASCATHLPSLPGDAAAGSTRMRTDLAAIGAPNPAVSPRLHDRIREAAVSPAPLRPQRHRRRPDPCPARCLGAIGASLGVGAHLAARPQEPDRPRVASGADEPAALWQTDVVALAAKEFWIYWRTDSGSRERARSAWYRIRAISTAGPSRRAGWSTAASNG